MLIDLFFIVFCIILKILKEKKGKTDYDVLTSKEFTLPKESTVHMCSK